MHISNCGKIIMQHLCNAQFYIKALLSLFQCSVAMPTLASTVAKQECICGYLSGRYWGGPNIRPRCILGISSFSSKCKTATGNKNLCYPPSLPLWLQCFEDQQKGRSYHDHESEFILTILIHLKPFT